MLDGGYTRRSRYAVKTARTDLQALKYAGPPDILQTQMDLYEEEKREDLEDQRLDLRPEPHRDQLLQVIARLEAASASYPSSWIVFEEILAQCKICLERDIDECVEERKYRDSPTRTQKTDLLQVIARCAKEVVKLEKE